MASCTSLPGGTDDEVGQVVAKTGWLPAVAAAGWLGPTRSFGRGAEKLVEFRVHVQARIRCVMRPDKEDARSPRRLEGDHDPESGSQVLHAEPIQRGRAGQPVSECRAAVGCQVVEERGEGPRVRPVQSRYLLLRAPRRSDFYWHT